MGALLILTYQIIVSGVNYNEDPMMNGFFIMQLVGKLKEVLQGSLHSYKCFIRACIAFSKQKDK